MISSFNPDNVPGRLGVVVRMGAPKLREKLPALIEAVRQSGQVKLPIESIGKFPILNRLGSHGSAQAQGEAACTHRSSRAVRPGEAPDRIDWEHAVDLFRGLSALSMVREKLLSIIEAVKKLGQMKCSIDSNGLGT